MKYLPIVIVALVLVTGILPALGVYREQEVERKIKALQQRADEVIQKPSPTFTAISTPDTKSTGTPTPTPAPAVSPTATPVKP